MATNSSNGTLKERLVFLPARGPGSRARRPVRQVVVLPRALGRAPVGGKIPLQLRAGLEPYPGLPSAVDRPGPLTLGAEDAPLFRPGLFRGGGLGGLDDGVVVAEQLLEPPARRVTLGGDLPVAIELGLEQVALDVETRAQGFDRGFRALRAEILRPLRARAARQHRQQGD